MKRNKPYMRDEDDQPAPRVKSISECAADNCPMPGVYGAIGSRTSYCRIHDEMPAAFWPALTDRARARITELHAALDLCNASPKNSGPYLGLLHEIRHDFENRKPL